MVADIQTDWDIGCEEIVLFLVGQPALIKGLGKEICSKITGGKRLWQSYLTRMLVSQSCPADYVVMHV